jgi:NADP-dependent 3-hydroxy acid dehydrogenase YdfG
VSVDANGAGLAGSIAVVTGGSQGIGLATVSALAREGMTVVAFARNQSRLQSAIVELAPDSRERVVGVGADVRDADSVIGALAEVTNRFGGFDVVVNSAGVSMSAKRRLVDSSREEWSRLIDTNLTGTYLMCRNALPTLESRGGYIINVLSTAAHRATAGVSLYAASKYGALALTEALIEEYRGGAVRISSISPGPVDTTIWEHKVEPPSADERARMMRPSDLADVIVWMLSRPPRLHVGDITLTPWTSA